MTKNENPANVAALGGAGMARRVASSRDRRRTFSSKQVFRTIVDPRITTIDFAETVCGAAYLITVAGNEITVTAAVTTFWHRNYFRREVRRQTGVNLIFTTTPKQWRRQVEVVLRRQNVVGGDAC
jgi:AraC-like DNA-binding protein